MRKLMSIWKVMPHGQRLFLIALATLIVIPFVVLLFLQVYNAYNLARLGNDIAIKENEWKAEAAALNARVDPESLKSPSNQFSYRLLEHHDVMVAERRAVVTIQEPLGENKQKSGQILSDETLVNRAAAKIQSMGEAECASMIASLAAECTVMSATGRRVSDVAYEYQIQLAFAERRGLGKVDPAASYEFIVTKSSPGRAVTSARLYYGKAAGERRKIYQDVADTCASIAQASGNCSVTSLSIASRLDRGTPMARLSASAAYASLVAASEVSAIPH
jgi:hypothetical protein